MICRSAGGDWEAMELGIDRCETGRFAATEEACQSGASVLVSGRPVWGGVTGGGECKARDGANGWHPLRSRSRARQGTGQTGG